MLEPWVGLSSAPPALGCWARCAWVGGLHLRDPAGPAESRACRGPSPGAAVDPQDSAGCWASASTRLSALGAGTCSAPPLSAPLPHGDSAAAAVMRLPQGRQGSEADEGLGTCVLGGVRVGGHQGGIG